MILRNLFRKKFKDYFGRKMQPSSHICKECNEYGVWSIEDDTFYLTICALCGLETKAAYEWYFD